MATFHIEVSGHKKIDGTYAIYIRMTHRQKLKRMKTSLVAFPSDLTKDHKLKEGNLKRKCEMLIHDLYDAQNKISLFDLPKADVNFIADSVKESLNGEEWHLDFFEFAKEFIGKARVKDATKDTYKVAVSALSRFVNGHPLDINDITHQFVQDFADFLDDEPKYYYRKSGGAVEKTKKSKQSGTGARAYITKLGTIFRAAQDRYNDEDGTIRIPRSPFQKIKTHERYTMRGQMGLSPDVFRSLISSEARDEYERQALDLFILSFCMMGANMVDLYEATPPKKGILSYNRQKTTGRSKDNHTFMQIRIPGCALTYITRLSEGAGKNRWLNLSNRFSKPDYATSSTNKYLKRWAERNGVAPFTFYAARKSWAGYARDLGIEKATIDECLAHVGDYRMADRYIGDRRSQLQWDANEKVCDFVFNRYPDRPSPDSESPQTPL